MNHSHHPHLLVGRRLLSLPDSVNCETDLDFGTNTDRTGLTQWMKCLNGVIEHFWKRWKVEYLTESHRNPQVKPTNDTVSVGDVVLIHEPKKPRSLWRMGQVEKLLHGSDGAVRGASLRVQSGDRRPTLLRQPVQHIYPLETYGVPVNPDLPATTQEPDSVDPVKMLIPIVPEERQVPRLQDLGYRSCWTIEHVTTCHRPLSASW